MSTSQQAEQKIADGSDCIAAESVLIALRRAGARYLFANAGTDFPSIIEAYAREETPRDDLPEPVVVPHETVAMGMAHGYFLITGEPQAVMVHVNVGLANAAMGAINASSDHAGVILCSGRTPVTEFGYEGARSSPIHWGQEMRDQAALVREAVKWEYELRYPEQSEDAVMRAAAIARNAPAGPVYLSLPREVLAAPDSLGRKQPAPYAPLMPGAADPAAIARAVELLAQARNPLIITQSLRGIEACEALARLAESCGIPTLEYFPTKNALPSAHPARLRRNPVEAIAEADVIVVLEAQVPWIPNQQPLSDAVKVIGIGADPVFERTPFRGFPLDVALVGNTVATLDALTDMLLPSLDTAEIAARLADVETHGARAGAEQIRAIEAARQQPMLPAWVSRCISEAKPADAIIFNEIGCDFSHLEFDRPGSYFSTPLSGGLGWGLPAAIGAQLADRSRQVIACVGDGSYVFANPSACHQVTRNLDLPLLVIVMNNGIWNAVRRATLHMYPDGDSAAARPMPLTSLGQSPDHCMIAEAYGAYAERVSDPDALPDALRRALAATGEGRQALLEIMVGV